MTVYSRRRSCGISKSAALTSYLTLRSLTLRYYVTYQTYLDMPETSGQTTWTVKIPYRPPTHNTDTFPMKRQQRDEQGSPQGPYTGKLGNTGRFYTSIATLKTNESLNPEHTKGLYHFRVAPRLRSVGPEAPSWRETQFQWNEEGYFQSMMPPDSIFGIGSIPRQKPEDWTSEVSPVTFAGDRPGPLIIDVHEEIRLNSTQLESLAACDNTLIQTEVSLPRPELL
jgi:hypothetical protein